MLLEIFLDTDATYEVTRATAILLATTAPQLHITGVGTKDNNTAHLLVDLVHEHPNEITVVVLGSLTHIAEALRLDPNLPRKVPRLLVTGGFFSPATILGQEIPRDFDHTFSADPEALQQVLAAGFTLEVLPGDLMFRADNPWTDGELNQVQALTHPALQRLAQLQKKAPPSNTSSPLFARPWVTGELLLTYLMYPNLFSLQKNRYRLTIHDGYPHFTEAEDGYPLTLITSANLWEVRQSILGHFRWIERGMPSSSLTDVELARQALHNAGPADKERLLRHYLRRVTERVRRVSFTVQEGAEELVGSMAGELTEKLLAKYRTIFDQACELELPSQPEITRSDPRWQKISTLVDQLFPIQFQPLLDHWGRGTITEVTGDEPYWTITTRLGTHVLVKSGHHREEPPSDTESSRYLTEHFTTSALLTSKKGTTTVHYEHFAYQLYHVTDKPTSLL